MELTAAEKAEAAKAEAAKQEEAKKAAAAKAAEENSNDETDDENESEVDDTETVEQLKKRLAKVNESDKKRRLENKALKEKQERTDKALEVLTGKKKDGEGEDPLIRAKKESDAKLARTLIKAELGSLAQDAHDPMMLFKTHGEKFKEIEVDLDNETVDRDALKEVIASIREETPYLFRPSDDEDGHTEVIIKKNPDKVRQGGGGSEYKEWDKLKKAGDKRGAQEFYAKNRSKILLQMGK